MKTARWTEKEFQELQARQPRMSITPIAIKRKAALPKDQYKNKDEREYAGRLEMMRQTGMIFEWFYEPTPWRLARKTFIIPDFLVVVKLGELEIHEVKGREREDWWVKWKIFIEKYRSIFSAFRVMKKIKGEWKQV